MAADNNQPVGLDLHWAELQPVVTAQVSKAASLSGPPAKASAGKPEWEDLDPEQKLIPQAAVASSKASSFAKSSSTAPSAIVSWPELEGPPAKASSELAVIPKGLAAIPKAGPKANGAGIDVDSMINDSALKYLQDATQFNNSVVDMGNLKIVKPPPNAHDPNFGLHVPPIMPAAMPMPMPSQQSKVPTDPKGALIHLCQKMCRRPITKQDVVYTMAKQGYKWEVIVQMNCLQGLEFRAEVLNPHDRKTAEKQVAEVALKALSQPPPGENSDPLVVPPPGQVAAPPPSEPWAVPPPSFAQVDISQAPLAGVDPGANPGPNVKAALKEALDMIVRRPLTKDSTFYQMARAKGGYQATLFLPCLPGAWGQQGWESHTCRTKKDAELSAAGIALASVMADPQFSAVLAAPKTTWSHWKGCGKGGMRIQQQKLTGTAPKTGLRVALEGDENQNHVWHVDISPATTLQSVRALIQTSRFSGLPDDYMFVNAGIPIPTDGECNILARDFLPCITITCTDLKGFGTRRARRREESPQKALADTPRSPPRSAPPKARSRSRRREEPPPRREEPRREEPRRREREPEPPRRGRSASRDRRRYEAPPSKSHRETKRSRSRRRRP